MAGGRAGGGAMGGKGGSKVCVACRRQTLKIAHTCARKKAKAKPGCKQCQMPTRRIAHTCATKGFKTKTKPKKDKTKKDKTKKGKTKTKPNIPNMPHGQCPHGHDHRQALIGPVVQDELPSSQDIDELDLTTGVMIATSDEVCNWGKALLGPPKSRGRGDLSHCGLYFGDGDGNFFKLCAVVMHDGNRSTGH